MLVVDDDDRLLLGRQATWPEGRFSTLAGFVEPGESLEQRCAARCTRRPASTSATVTYLGSQPWPFPSSLMLGFTAQARTTEVHRRRRRDRRGPLVHPRAGCSPTSTPARLLVSPSDLDRAPADRALVRRARCREKPRMLTGMSWLDALGWAGSALLVYSLLQARVLRFRVLNLVASLVLVVFNALLGIWPMVAMNPCWPASTCGSSASCCTERHDDTAYEVLEVGPDDAYLQPRAAGARRGHPAVLPGVLRRSPTTVRRGRRSSSQRGDETVGVVLVARDAGGRCRAGRARLRHAAVPRLHARASSCTGAAGCSAAAASARCSPRRGWCAPYYERLGFRRDGDHYALDLDPA